MKLRSEFITYSANGEALLVPTGAASFSGLVKGNRTLEAILELLKQDTDEAAIVAAMQARFDASEEVIKADVKKVLDELRAIGALDE